MSQPHGRQHQAEGPQQRWQQQQQEPMPRQQIQMQQIPHKDRQRTSQTRSMCASNYETSCTIPASLDNTIGHKDSAQFSVTSAHVGRTTVMIRNMPNNYTRAMLLEMMDSKGFRGQYDFIYMPIDFVTRVALGYSFINFVSTEQAECFWDTFDGFTDWMIPSKKICTVSWADPHQGLSPNIERYRNSPVMHEKVPDIYKPLLFVDGVRLPFPAPTKKLRAPRIRHLANGGRNLAELPK